MNRLIYFDHNATTAVAPDVLDAMLPWLSDKSGFGNPYREHWAGLPAKEAIAHASHQVADLIGAKPEHIVFTSGGSESVNHAIKGVFFAFFNEPNKRHIITTAIEHPAASAACNFLRDCFGAEITEITVDENCMLDVEQLRCSLRPDTVLINVMHANHETGAIQPVQEVAKIASERGVLLHVDATCSVGKNVVDVNDIGCDLMSFSGHKFYAPKGVGGLYVGQRLRQGIAGRNGTLEFVPLIHGSAPKQMYRSGTGNVPSIVGMGKAAELARAWNTRENRDQLRALTIEFWESLKAALGDCVLLNGPADHNQRVCNTLNVSFIGQDGQMLLSRAPGIAASSGPKTTEIVQQMGRGEAAALGAIRFSLGKKNTSEEVQAAVTEITAVIIN